MQSETHLINNCIGLLEQAFDLLERIDDQVYSSTSPISPRASIGGHLRHVLDFYQSFLCKIGSGRVDYNLRERDTAVEEYRVHARERIRATTAALRSLSLNNEIDSLLVRTEDDGATAPSWSTSSVLRELDFLQSHTIHHYSLIAMLLRSHAVELDEEFGVAPSTLKHWREEATCAR
jgi:uncharacterized damage-inducible protein DinB